MKNFIAAFFVLTILISCDTDIPRTEGESGIIPNNSSSKEIGPNEGHNGIGFAMSQSDIEKLGFVCKPSDLKPTLSFDWGVAAICAHREMIGNAFGYKTRDYIVAIGKDGKIGHILASFAEITSLSDYLDLTSKVDHFYPIKEENDEQDAILGKAGWMADRWRANNNSALELLYMDGAPPLSKEKISVYFISPHRINKEDAAQAN